MARAKGTTEFERNPDKFLKAAHEAAKAGHWRNQIARACGISHETFSDYMQNFPDFLEAVESGEQEYQQRIEKALDKSAEGHQITKTKKVERYVYTKDKDGKIVGEPAVVVSRVETVVEDVPPNPKSMELVLINKTKNYKSAKQDFTGFLANAEGNFSDEQVKALAEALHIKLEDASAPEERTTKGS